MCLATVEFSEAYSSPPPVPNTGRMAPDLHSAPLFSYPPVDWSLLNLQITVRTRAAYEPSIPILEKRQPSSLACPHNMKKSAKRSAQEFIVQNARTVSKDTSKRWEKHQRLCRKMDTERSEMAEHIAITGILTPAVHLSGHGPQTMRQDASEHEGEDIQVMGLVPMERKIPRH
ncbi:unnamed protein product [Protopolystoma xenopodis]|uniref:Uncharacterized protein n=1 Tax=Protopolystoma xenopodis TaxID=117903 RepID=A0A3S5ABX3_9PLAT|nr:unnamed protein product [Protopolystoma xenopodis]